MFARKVAARLKPNSLMEFTTLLEFEILPWLRTQEGFLDLIVLAAPDGTEVATLSFWQRVTDAQAYNSRSYPAVLKTLEGLLDGIPYLKTFDVVSSTLQSVALTRPTKVDSLVQETSAARLAYLPHEGHR